MSLCMLRRAWHRSRLLLHHARPSAGTASVAHELLQRQLRADRAVARGDEEALRVGLGGRFHCGRGDAGEVRAPHRPRQQEIVVVVAQQRAVRGGRAPLGHDVLRRLVLAAGLGVDVRHAEVEGVRELRRQLRQPLLQLLHGVRRLHLHPEAHGVRVGVRVPAAVGEDPIDLPQRRLALLRRHALLGARAGAGSVRLAPGGVLDQRRGGEHLGVAQEDSPAVLGDHSVRGRQEGEALQHGGGARAADDDDLVPCAAHVRKELQRAQGDDALHSCLGGRQLEDGVRLALVRDEGVAAAVGAGPLDAAQLVGGVGVVHQRAVDVAEEDAARHCSAGGCAVPAAGGGGGGPCEQRRETQLRGASGDGPG
mmetsp:Transcript_20585/g.52763  ORF Transcript_20585/g.52763 Transcript_20585/m.52763 type:complete len:366 (-) Transcript_20585:39-1136(-)